MIQVGALLLKGTCNLVESDFAECCRALELVNRDEEIMLLYFTSLLNYATALKIQSHYHT